MTNKINWIEDDGSIVADMPDGSNYGIARDFVDGHMRYMPYHNPAAKMGGYLDHRLLVVCGFGTACAIGYHPDTICKTLEEAQERCQRHWESIDKKV